MPFERSRNASRNIFFGMVLKLYQIIVPFIIRTIMIYILGLDYVGLNGLFNSILQVLNLTELGVGTAMIFSMYKPIVEEDKDTICKLMQLYKIYYRIIGLIIAVVGVGITPVIPKLVSAQSLLPLNINYLYWINLSCTVLTYWLFAYKASILQAHQRNDVISKLGLLSNTVMYALQIVFLLIFKSYYLFLLGMLIGQIGNNMLTSIVVDKMYSQYKAKGKLSDNEVREINQRVKDLFTAKVGGVIQNSSDAIVISAFLGLTILAKYQNYYYVLNAVFGFVVIVFNSCLAGVGNSIVIEDKEKNYYDFKKIAFISEWIAIFCSCCLLCLYQPFIRIWVGEENLLSNGVVLCMAIYIWTIITNQMLCLYKDASGIWHKDRFRPLIVAAVNLVLNLLTVRHLQLYGVILSTVLSILVLGMPWLIYNLFSEVFKRSCKAFSLDLIKYILVGIMACMVSYCICIFINDGLFGFVLKMLICCIIPNFIMYILFHNSTEFDELLKLVKRLIIK